MSGPALRTIVADDDPLARLVVKEALRAAGIVVIAEASSGREAVELTLHYGPDVVLMDVVMPDVGGLDATRQIAAARPDVRVIVLTASEDDDVGLLCLRAGAVGFLGKDVDLATLALLIRAVHRGEAAVSGRLAMSLVDHMRRVPEAGAGMRPVRSGLTDREWEVLDLLSQGHTTDGIADELVLSTETVRSHIKNIMRKLGVRSRADAVAMTDRLRSEISPT